MDDTTEILKNHNYILLFDGDCSLCNRTVRIIMQFERKPKLVFAGIGSEIGKKLTEMLFPNGQIPDSLVLIENGQALVKAKAALRIATILGGVFYVFSVLKLLPASWLDTVYDWVARNRIRWFGRTSHCGLMPHIDRKRFLDL